MSTVDDRRRYYSGLFLSRKDGSFSFVRQLFWRYLYGFSAFMTLSKNEWQFMNYGYLPEDGTIIALKPEDSAEISRVYSTQLYHVVANAVPIEGKDVLEVGSGRGGGSSYVARYLQPKFMTGVELSAFAVDLANKTHSNVPNLRFVQGDALNLQFDDDRFDVVINVESAHCYPDFLKFTKEVYRVLKPGGFFAFTDMVMAPDVASINEHFSMAGFTITEEVDISSSVVRALQKCSEERLRRWEERFGTFLYNLFLPVYRNFACVEGSQHYTNFASGDLKYMRYVAQKPIDTQEKQCLK